MIATSAAPETPETGAKIDFLDGWRGLAIGALMVGHFAPVPGINFGAVGLELFFVLSGHPWRGSCSCARHRSRSSIADGSPGCSQPSILLLLGVGLALTEPSGRSGRALGVGTLPPQLSASAGRGRRHAPGRPPLVVCVEEHSYILLSLVAIAARHGDHQPVWLPGALLAVTYTFVALYTLVPALGVTHFRIRTECRAGSIVVSALLACLVAQGRLRVPGWTVPLIVIAGLATFWWRFPE